MNAEYYIDKANEYLSDGDYIQAIKNYNLALDLSPNNLIALLNRCFAFIKIRYYDRAIKDATVVIEAAPNLLESYVNRGLAYLESDKNAEAVKDYTAILELDSSFVNAYLNRGVALIKLNKLKDAIEDFSSVIEINPNYPKAYAGRAHAYTNQKLFDNAIADLSVAIFIKPDFTEAYLNRGRCFLYQKKYNEALNDFNIATDIEPNNPNPYNHRRHLFLLTNDYQKAYQNIVMIEELCIDKYSLYEFSAGILNFFKTNNAPLLCNRVIDRLYNLNTFISYMGIIQQNNEDCHDIIDLLNYFETYAGPNFNFKLLHGVIRHYLGDPSVCYKIFKDLADNMNIKNLMVHYYFILSCEDYMKNEFELINKNAIELVTDFLDKDIEGEYLQYYYAGQIMFLNNEYLKAIECFTKYDDFIPSLCMKILCLNLTGNLGERDTLLNELTILDKENKGLLQYTYIPRINKISFEETIIKYCHIREIEGIIPLITNYQHPFDVIVAEKYKKILRHSKQTFIIDKYSEEGKNALNEIKIFKQDLLDSYCLKIEKAICNILPDIFALWNSEVDKLDLELSIASVIPIIYKERIVGIEPNDMIDYFTVKEKIDYPARFLLTIWAELNKYANRRLSEIEKKAVKYSIGFLFGITLAYFSIPKLNIVPSIVVFLGENLTKDFFTQRIIEFIEENFIKSDEIIPKTYSDFKSEFTNYFESIY